MTKPTNVQQGGDQGNNSNIRPPDTPSPTHTDIQIDCILVPQDDNRNRSEVRLVRLQVFEQEIYFDRNTTFEFCAQMFLFDLGEHVDGYVAFLNGINGEATNSDDVDGLGEVLFSTLGQPPLSNCTIVRLPNSAASRQGFTAADRVALNTRNNREAKSHKMSRDPGAKRSKNFGPINVAAPGSGGDDGNKNNITNQDVSSPGGGGELRVTQTKDEETQGDISQISRKPKDIRSIYIIPNNDNTIAADGSTLYYDGNNYHTEKFAEFVPEDFTWFGVDSGAGWVVVSSDEEKNKKPIPRTPCLSKVTIDAYMRKDMNGIELYFKEETFIVVGNLLVDLRKNLPTAEVDVSLNNGALALSGRHDIPTHLSANTINYYMCLKHRLGAATKGRTGVRERVSNDGTIIADGDYGRTDTLTDLGIEVDLKAILWEPDVECPVMPFVLRTDYDILSSSPNTLDDEEPKRIKMRGERVIPKRRGRNRFFSYRGKGLAPFISYGDTSNNMNQGLKRLMGARDNEDAYRCNAILTGEALKNHSVNRFNFSATDMYEKLLGGRQAVFPEEDPAIGVRQFVAKHIYDITNLCSRSTIQKFLDRTQTSGSWLYYKMYHDYLTFMSPFISRQGAAEILHVKRALRRQYVNGRRLHTDDDIMVRHMQASIKRELAKFGKAPRLFVQYGAGAMYANELPEFVKLCIDGLHIVNFQGNTLAMYVMAKPRDKLLSELFTLLKQAMSTQGLMQVIIFSDDSCVSGMDSKSWGFNVDISSNDSSQDIPAFLATFLSMKNFHRRRAEGLIEQCLLPINIINPERTDQKVCIKFKGPYEGSGTVLTTVLNHYASMMIYLAAFKLWCEGTDIKDSIIRGALIIGHQVTVEQWGVSGVEIQKAQFLKRSPVCVEGNIIPQVNLGCILRAMGSVDDELDAIKLGISQPEFLALDMNARMQRFFSAVMAGWCHESGNSIINALRTRFNSSIPAEIVVKHDSLINLVEDSYPVFTDDGLIHRYGLTPEEIQEAVVLILNTRLGMHMSCVAFSKIYSLDYGIPYQP